MDIENFLWDNCVGSKYPAETYYMHSSVARAILYNVWFLVHNELVVINEDTETLLHIVARAFESEVNAV